MRRLSFYRELEGDAERGDPFEGDSALFQAAHLSRITIGDHEIAPSDLAGPIRLSNSEDRTCAVFCMLAIGDQVVEKHLRSGLPLVNRRSTEFGEAALVVRDLPRFFDRLERALRAERLSARGAFIEYVDITTHNGDLGPLRKDARFGHQQEWRLVVSNPPSDPLVLLLGDLTDITSIVDSRTAVLDVEAVESGLSEPSEKS